MELPHAARIASRLEVVAESASTNADLRGAATDPDAWPHLSTLITTNQTAGRGRLDRRWIAPPGSALAISVLLRRLPPVPVRGWLPLAAGVAMADAVSAQLPAHEVGVKWPNDVLVDGRKICGILVEAASDAVIVGAGVNTAMTAEQLPVPTATSFAVVGVRADEDRLLAAFLTRLQGLVARLVATGDAVRSGVHAAVTERCLSLGREVEVVLPDGDVLRGRAVELSQDGRLAVSADGIRHLVGAGDVTHARLA